MTDTIRCCEFDTDGDGNCHIHAAPGILRRNAAPPAISEDDARTLRRVSALLLAIRFEYADASSLSEKLNQIADRLGPLNDSEPLCVLCELPKTHPHHDSSRWPGRILTSHPYHPFEAP